MQTQIPKPSERGGRYICRVSVLVRMTGVEKRYVKADVDTIANRVEDFARKEGYDWECWCAHREVPWWEEEAAPHDKAELFDVNRRVAGVSDAAIIHGFDNGSATLGYLYKALVDAPHHPTILVLAHQTETLSKAWEGQEHHHLAVRFERFSGDDMGSLELHNVVGEWLREHATTIEDGPRRRLAVEEAFSDQAHMLVAAWKRASRDVRRTIGSCLMLPEAAIGSLLNDPIGVASLTAYDFATVVGELNIGAGVFIDVENLLGPAEVAAWELWSAQKPPVLARAVLVAAIQERRKLTVANEVGDLTQAGGWESLRRLWERGLVG